MNSILEMGFQEISLTVNSDMQEMDPTSLKRNLGNSIFMALATLSKLFSLNSQLVRERIHQVKLLLVL